MYVCILYLVRKIGVYVYVIARVGVKFGINLPLNLTRVELVPEISRLSVLLKINTIASLFFI